MRNLSSLVGHIPRKVAVGIAGLIVVVGVIAAIALATSGGGDSDTSRTAVGPDLAPTSTPEPTPEPPPANRADCYVIWGTPFLSPEEEVWFKENCATIASTDGPAVPPGAGNAQVPIGDRIVIPAAGVSADVYRVTVPTDGQMPDPTGYFNAVWYDFSKLPGFGGYVNIGNLVLSGHVDCARCRNGGSGTAVFWSVRNLKEGDTAQYLAADGKMLNYVVTVSRSISPNADWDSIVASWVADMTLITCTGSFSGGEYNLRHVVLLKKQA